MPSLVKYQRGGNNIFKVILNGTEVGTVESKNDAYSALRIARKAISDSTDELTLATSNISVEGSNVIWGTVESPNVVADRMKAVLDNNKKKFKVYAVVPAMIITRRARSTELIPLRSMSLR